MRIPKIFNSLIILVAICANLSVAQAADQSAAVNTVQDFYKRYLASDFSKMPTKARPKIALSKAFAKEIKRSDVDCKKYGEGPCGWGADGDEYLDAQEIAPDLSYSNSGISIKEISLGTVQVKLNVYPSEKSAGDYYNKTITYKIIVENGKYLVDDMAYSDGISARQRLAEERAYIRANPAPKPSKINK